MSKHFGWLALTLLAMVVPACGSSTWATIHEKPFWRIPDHTKVALVTVDVGKKVAERQPSDFSNAKAILLGALTASLGGKFEIVDKTDLGFKQTIAPIQKEAKKLWIFTEDAAPTLPADQVWGAEAPKGLPNGVVEPLTLAVKVLAWTLNNEEIPDGKTTKSVPTARLDLVYSLWTKSGTEVETVRVLSTANSELSGTSVRSLPERSFQLVGNFRPQDGFTGDREKVFRAAVANAATWYTWPMLEHEVRHRADWIVNDDRDKAAIKLADEGKWQEAFAAWKTIADADSKAWGAVYNMAEVSRVLGNEEDALAFYTKACAIEDNGRNRGVRDAMKERLKLYRDVLGAPAAP